MNLENFNIDFEKLIYTLIAFGIIFILRKTTIKLIRKFAKKLEIFQVRTSLIIQYVNILSFFLILLCLLFIWSINFQDLGLFLSSIFAVIGIAFFAQWLILSNITSGIIMFFTFPYKIGDVVKIHEGDHSLCGEIEEIRAFHVVIKTLEDEIITYPNSLLLQKGVSILNEENIEKLGKMKTEKNEE